MRLWEDCLAFCERGLALDPSNTDLARLREQAARDRTADERRQAEDEALAAEKRAPAAALARTLLGRGWRIGRPQFSVGGLRCGGLLWAGGAVFWAVCWSFPRPEAHVKQEFPNADAVPSSPSRARMPCCIILCPVLPRCHLPRTPTPGHEHPSRAGDSKPSLDEEGDVHWPVILFYPEANMQQDVIQDFCSSDRFW